MPAFQAFVRTTVYAATAALLAGSASAEPFGGVAVGLSGGYVYQSTAKRDGHPACSERWYVNGDGTLTVLNGSAGGTETLQTATDDHFNWLILGQLSNGGGAYCAEDGTTVSKLNERRYVIYQAKAGNLIVCRLIFLGATPVPQPFAILNPIHPSSDPAPGGEGSNR